MQPSKLILALWVAITCVATSLQAATLKLAPFYSDSMVFQREKPIVILGLADANATIEASFMGGTAKTTADANGLFKLVLPAKEASSQGSTATITSGDGKIVLNDVLVGDVWLCSGQSNMEWTMNGCGALGQDDVKSANYPLIRRIKFPHETAVDPVPYMNMKVSGPWAAATAATVGNWTAVGFYFAKNIHANSKIPIGILDCNWGGTKIEPWTPGDAFSDFPALANDVKTLQGRHELVKKNAEAEKDYQAKLAAATPEERKKMRKPGMSWGNGSPTAIYNSMVDGMTPLAIKGAIWYQGCSNAGDPLYDKHMEALASGWRTKWGYEFPFYFVQLANFQDASTDPSNVGWGKVRNLQLNAFHAIPSCGMAVIIDIGEAKNIHPQNKFDVGDRLARWALRDLYGSKETVVSGPIYKAMTLSGKQAIISFDYVAASDKRQSLMVGKKEGKAPTIEVTDGKLEGFAVQDKDGKWSWANAVIEGSTLVVTHPEGKEPTNVRYAFQSNPKANLYNKEGLPASPFTTEK
jgi:sialate O-acetylesterase